MRSRPTSAFLVVLLAALAAGAALATAAGATPAWYFENEELAGIETIEGSAAETSIEVPGLTTTCEGAVFEMTIENVAGAGVGEVTGLPFANCSTSAAVCSVEVFEADTLPWASELVTVGPSFYVYFEGVEIDIVYSGEECVLNEFLVEVDGSAGGLIDNEAEGFTFDPASFEATGAELTAFGQDIDWNGVFAMEATGAATGLALTVGL